MNTSQNADRHEAGRLLILRLARMLPLLPMMTVEQDDLSEEDGLYRLPFWIDDGEHNAALVYDPATSVLTLDVEGCSSAPVIAALDAAFRGSR